MLFGDAEVVGPAAADPQGGATFVHDPQQRRLAEESKRRLQESGRFERPILSAIEDATALYPAEENHQDHYRKNPLRYKSYRRGSGRDQFLQEVWGEKKD